MHLLYCISLYICGYIGGGYHLLLIYRRKKNDEGQQGQKLLKRAKACKEQKLTAETILSPCHQLTTYLNVCIQSQYTYNKNE